MEDYYEYRVLVALAESYIIAYLTGAATGKEIASARLIAAALIGAFIALVEPYLTAYEAGLKIVCALITVLILHKEYDLREFFLTLSVYAIIYLVFLGGETLAVKYLGDEIAAAFSISFGVIGGYIAIRTVAAALQSRKKRGRFIYKIEIDGKEYKGYYDSGNKLYDDDGNPIVVVTRALKEKLNLCEEGSLSVRSVSGVKEMPLVSLTLEIYFEGGKNKIYRTRAVVSDGFGGGKYDVILHKDMEG